MRRWIHWLIISVILCLATYSAVSMNRLVPRIDAQTKVEVKDMGTFRASWFSGGIEIVVTATQRDDEDEPAFADRCARLVREQLERFPKDKK